MLGDRPCSTRSHRPSNDWQDKAHQASQSQCSDAASDHQRQRRVAGCRPGGMRLRNGSSGLTNGWQCSTCRSRPQHICTTAGLLTYCALVKATYCHLRAFGHLQQAEHGQHRVDQQYLRPMRRGCLLWEAAASPVSSGHLLLNSRASCILGSFAAPL